jgi:hypothetical protein
VFVIVLRSFNLIHISIVSNRGKTLCFTSDYENIHPKTNPNTQFYSITYINVNFVKKNVMSWIYLKYCTRAIIVVTMRKIPPVTKKKAEFAKHIFEKYHMALDQRI